MMISALRGLGLSSSGLKLKWSRRGRPLVQATREPGAAPVQRPGGVERKRRGGEEASDSEEEFLVHGLKVLS